MTYRQRQKIKAKSSLAKRMANARWALDRERREFIASHDPIVTGRVMRRIIDIDERSGTMTEIVIRDFDSAREVRRKLRTVGMTISARRI